MDKQTIKAGDKVKVVLTSISLTPQILRYVNNLVCEVVEVSCAESSRFPIKVKGTDGNNYKVMFSEVELVKQYLTKEEWLKGLLDGKIGRQSGNPDQKWYWDGATFCSACAGYVTRNACLSDLYMNYGRKLWLEEPCTEMTIKEIEEKLGVTNLKIVKE